MRTQLLVAAAALALASWGCSADDVERVNGLDREHLLSVLGTVHANPEVHVHGGEHTSKGEHCLREFTRDIQPVCASNGKKYSNMSIFVYEQCLQKAQEGTEIAIVDMEFCKEAELEDLGQR